MTQEQASLCEAIKRLGFGSNKQVKLYGEVFNLVSDPVSIGNNFVFVDALEQKSGDLRRIRIPLSVVQMANKNRKAA
jgi:hypothetical protein